MQGIDVIYKKRNHRVRRYTTKSCEGCKLREECTANKKGRIIERSIYQEAIEANKKRVEENPDYYKLRQQITEHQFGTLKRQWDFTYTLMRGKANVMSEVNIVMMVYNLRRLMSIFSIKELTARLRSLGLSVLPLYGLIRSILMHFILTPMRLELKYSVN